MSSWNKAPEPDKPENTAAEVVVASAEAVFVYAGHLEDGTRVVRDSDGLLYALAAVRRGGQEQANRPSEPH